jgi:transcriptional regulator with XRE-family HTH domain
MTKHAPSVNALEWLNSLTPDTPEMRAIGREESALIELARTLRLAREAAGLTQTQLAKRIGVSQPQISKWEDTVANHTIQSILKYLGGLGEEAGQEGAAELVLAVRTTSGKYLPVTTLAERAVILEENANRTVAERAAITGKNRNEIVADLLGSIHTAAGTYAAHVIKSSKDVPTLPKPYANVIFPHPEAA